MTVERLHCSIMAGAELANILNEAALEAVRRGSSTTEDPNIPKIPKMSTSCGGRGGTGEYLE